MKKLVLLGLLAAAGVYVHHAKHKRLPDIPLAPAAATAPLADSCEGRSKCLVIYMAPWCPACKKSLPMLKPMSDKLAARDAGLRVIVGMAEAEKLETFAAEMPVRTYIDPDKAFQNAASVSGVPTWLVIDGEGRIKERMSGSYANVDVQLEKVGLVE